MTVVPTPLADCFVIIPRVFNDDRGYFYESYNEKAFAEKTGQHVHFIQDNQSYSTKGVLRGLHLQALQPILPAPADCRKIQFPPRCGRK